MLKNFFCLVLLLLANCTNIFPPDRIDPSGDLDRADYLALRDRAFIDDDEMLDQAFESVASTETAPNAAPTQKVEQQPNTQRINTKRISLSVTDSTPLRDVLIELGREGKINIEIDPRISGGIIFTAHNQPFYIVLRRVCELAGLRYRYDDDFVRIELDEPFQKSYPLNYLSLARKTNSEVSISTNVFDVDLADQSGNSTGSGSNSSNNSTARITSVTEADFWGELKKSLPYVLKTASSYKSLVSNKKNRVKAQTNFSIDRQAGLVTIFGNTRQHNAAEKYLKRLEKKVSAQVLIEARIIEVELDEKFQSGINWTALTKNVTSATANFGSSGAAGLISSGDTGVFTALLKTDDITGVLNLVKTFGTTRVLSSPRLTVMNNQTAVLKVARNEVYFLTTAQFPTTLTSNGTSISGTPVFSSTPHTVPVGLVMTVQPAINSQTSRVTMTLRPTISRVVKYISDPSISLNAANANNSSTIESKIPVLAVREMDSVLQLQSGQVAVLGGLMQDSSDNKDQGIPFFDTLPIIGNLAKSRSNDGKVSELVILLRATILKSAAPDATDIDLYQRYNRDPRSILLPPT